MRRDITIFVWQVISDCFDARPCNDFVVLRRVRNCLCIIICVFEKLHCSIASYENCCIRFYSDKQIELQINSTFFSHYEITHKWQCYAVIKSAWHLKFGQGHHWNDAVMKTITPFLIRARFSRRCIIAASRWRSANFVCKIIRNLQNARVLVSSKL